ncbi:phosphatase PAP2 family protein [Bremerella cremea]|nr:phosphatase PAP2 family protein [Bremerella cremea]
MPELHNSMQPPSQSLSTKPPVSSGPVSNRLLLWMVAAPLLVLAVLTTLCYLTPLDLVTTRQFFSASGNPFPFRETWLANLIYDYGPLPAIVFGTLSGVVFLASFVFASLRPARKGAFFCLLAIVIGPGILINSVLKPYWGRPRPCDIVAFGGQQNYIPPGTIGPYEMAKSFPSGHASMGYVFMLPAFLLLNKHRRTAAAVFAIGVLLGAGVGASRIAEGGHFLSDIAWSGAIVYFTGLALYVVMFGWDRAATQSLKQAEAPERTIPFSRPQREAEPRETSAA